MTSGLALGGHKHKTRTGGYNELDPMTLMMLVIETAASCSGKKINKKQQTTKWHQISPFLINIDLHNVGFSLHVVSVLLDKIGNRIFKFY